MYTLYNTYLRKFIRIFHSDARHFQLLFLGSFLWLGIGFLQWEILPWQIPINLITACTIQYLAIRVRNIPAHSLKSAVITALSMSILFRTDQYLLIVLSTTLAIASKFILRFNGKHVYNPANFGICTTILFSQSAWISPGQWGHSYNWIFLVGILGWLVVSKAQRLELSGGFLAGFGLFFFLRMIVWQGWPEDHFIHLFTNGSTLLFTFFMISDPASTPNTLLKRLTWSLTIGLFAAYLQAFWWITAAPLWALFFLSPLTPVLDRVKITHTSLINLHIGLINLNPLKIRLKMKNHLSMLLLSIGMLSTTQSKGFCGFYVARAEARLFNKTSQVIVVRNGDQNTITMSSDFSGNVTDFAMVIPVPVVIGRDDIRIVDRRIFDQLDAYSGPRLVEYTDAGPCPIYKNIMAESISVVRKKGRASSAESDEPQEDNPYRVAVLARYTVGEYDIRILNALQSEGLRRWLTDNGYRIPEGADEVLEPYIKSNMKFFVVKVNLEAKNNLAIQTLRPIQIRFNANKFMLPIRLGMANGEGQQDMIVYAFSRNGRIEATNYRTLKMPTDRNVPVFVKEHFGKFYTDLYKRNLSKEGVGTLFLEYAWDLSGQNQLKCDPCAAEPPLYSEIRDAGVDWLQTNRSTGYTGSLFFTRLHVSYDRAHFPQDLVFQETSNRDNYQCRYVLNHPANYVENCPEWARYQEEKIQSRKNELRELAALTGWDVTVYKSYPYTFSSYDAPSPRDQRSGSIETPTDKAGINQAIVPSQSTGQNHSTTQPSLTHTQNSAPPRNVSPVDQLAFLNEETANTREQNTGEQWNNWLGLIAIAGIALLVRNKS
jgi:Na+-transporting NADH:ubiquinone oxidoreductase subunit NqrB